MIVKVRRTIILSKATLGIMTCGEDLFFCMEHSLVRGRRLRATRAGQYVIGCDVLGLFFVDDLSNVVRIAFGRDVAHINYPVVLVGATLKENKLYDTAAAADRLITLIAAQPNGSRIELYDPEGLRYGMPAEQD